MGLLLGCRSSLYILYISSLSDMTCKYFFLFCRLPFHCVDYVLWYTNVLHFNVVQFIYFYCCCLYISRKYLTNHMSWVVPPSYILIFDPCWINFCFWYKLSDIDGMFGFERNWTEEVSVRRRLTVLPSLSYIPIRYIVAMMMSLNFISYCFHLTYHWQFV